MRIAIIDMDDGVDAWRASWEAAGLPGAMPDDAHLVVSTSWDDSSPSASWPGTYWLTYEFGSTWVLWAQRDDCHDPGVDCPQYPVAWTSDGPSDPKQAAASLLRAFWLECRRAVQSEEQDQLFELGLLSDRDARALADEIWR